MNLLKIKKEDDNLIANFLRIANNDKIVKFLTINYDDELTKLSQGIYKRYSNVPFQENDFYNICLYQATIVAKEYNENLNVPFIKYLLFATKLLLMTEAKYWLRKKRIHTSIMINLRYEITVDDAEIDVVDQDSLIEINKNINSIDWNKFVLNLSISQKRITYDLLSNDSEGMKKLYTTYKLNKVRKEILNCLTNFYGNDDRYI